MTSADFRPDLVASYEASLKAKVAFRSLIPKVEEVAQLIVEAFKSGHKLLICGNGGSAADAQHFAAELMGRYKSERQALPALALSTDTSFLTAWSNDYEYQTIFSRQVEGLAKPGDIFFGISTSGNSKNVVLGAKKARELNLKVVGLVGEAGGALSEFTHHIIQVPSRATARIQECHLLTYHLICEFVDHAFDR